MASALEFAKAHFSAKARIRIEVPEWKDDAGDPLVIYARPLTLAEKQRIDKHAQDKGRISALAFTVILKAEKEDGSKHFRLDEMLSFQSSIDPDVTARIAANIVAPEAFAVEEAGEPAGKPQTAG